MLPTENPWPAMIVLLCVAVLCVGKWIGRRKIGSLVIAVVCILLGAGCYLLDMYVQTAGELITQNVYDLTTAFQQQNVPKTLGFFSAQAIPERVLISTALNQVRVGEDLRVSDVSVTFKAANSLAISHFRANASVTINIPGGPHHVSYHPSRWELDWQKEAGEWKIVKVHRLNPITGKETGFMSAD